MPNDNTAVCGCGVVLDLPKSRSGNLTAISTRDFTIIIQKGCAGGGKSSSNKTIEGRPPASLPGERSRGPNSRAPADCTGSTSSVTEGSRRSKQSNKKDKRSGRRARSAERPDSHYTYIDSGSSIVSTGIRENALAEALYCTIDDDDLEPQQQQQQQQAQSSANPTTSSTGNNGANPSQQQQQQQNQPANNATVTQNNRPQQPIYAVPSMTSPPPTYDVAIAKSWQLGLPPSYEEYLYHKHALLTRSHTPPPPWTDSSNGASVSGSGAGPGPAGIDLQQMSRELLASQPELREYLTRLALQGSAEEAIQQYHQLLSQQQQALRKQASRAQRSARAMPPRSQSESRANQQRIAYEDGAFCMETTAIQSAFENGVAFCSLM